MGAGKIRRLLRGGGRTAWLTATYFSEEYPALALPHERWVLALSGGHPAAAHSATLAGNVSTLGSQVEAALSP